MRVWRRGSNWLGLRRYRSAGRVDRLLGFGSEVLSEVQSKKDSNKRKPDLCRLILTMFEPCPSPLDSLLAYTNRINSYRGK